MGTFEYFFFDPGHSDPARAAVDLAVALGMDAVRSRSGETLVVERKPSPPRALGGEVSANVYGDLGPEDPADATEQDVSIYDDLPLVWSVRIYDGSYAEQQRRARRVFDLMVARLGWPTILTHEFETLVATYDPQRGLREFPPGTRSDGTGRHLWG